jgi:hypothetical protein
MVLPMRVRLVSLLAAAAVAVAGGAAKAVHQPGIARLGAGLQ